MPGILEGHYIKLEEKSLHITFVSIHDLTLYQQSSAQRVFKSLRSAYPQAYTYRSINIDSGRDWKSAIKDLSSNESVAWGDTVTLSSHESHQISLDVRASFELDRMLDSGEVIGKLQTSWDEPLDHGEEPFVRHHDHYWRMHIRAICVVFLRPHARPSIDLLDLLAMCAIHVLCLTMRVPSPTVPSSQAT